MAVDLGSIKFYLGPRDVDPSGPSSTLDDLEAVIVDFIAGAEKSLDIAVQELDNQPIAEAIVEAQLRGVRVRIISEADYLVEDKPAANPFTSSLTLGQEKNRLIQMALLRASAWVRTDFNPEIFHQKFIIRDGQAVLTGSANFTDTDTHKNLNAILTVEDVEVAKEFSREYTELRRGQFGRYSVAPPAAGGHTIRPKELLVGDVRVKVCFAPDHGPEMEIMKQMLKARERIDFAIFTFSGSSGIDDTMLSIHERIRLRGLIDRTQGGSKYAPTKALAAAGIEMVFVGGNRKGIRKLHHKMMVIDDSLTILGSFNYTQPANLYNDENIVVLGDLENPTPGQKAIAMAARKEIDRMAEVHGSPVPVPGLG